MFHPLYNYSYMSAESKFGRSLECSLIGNIRYNDPGVFRRLRISEISALTDDEIKSLNAGHKDDIKLLKRLSRLAGNPGFKTETDIQYHKGWKNGSQPFGLDGMEDRMRKPLLRLLRGITESANAGTTLAPKRVFRRARKMRQEGLFLHPECIHTRRAPDMECVPVSADESDFRDWSVRYFFVEVEPSGKNGPNVSQPDEIPEIVLQSAEQASYILNKRPFLLFCVGFLIFGTKFCLGIFDRQGVVFSGVYDMFGRFDIFVRVVRSLTCVLSTQELGFDPTVRMLTDEATMVLTGKEQDHPSAVITVSSVGLPPTDWCTVGRPMWTESSLLRWGTHVWRVKRCYIDKNGQHKLNDVEMILKTSWRSSTRNSELDIYHHVQTLLPNASGIAKVECGDDVIFPESRAPITVQNLRDYPQCSDMISKTEHTAVLHRLVIDNPGDFLWNYDDERQLLRAFRDALLAHKALSDHGVLHREITPWNILLSRTAIDGSYGFLTGLILARLPHESDWVHISDRNVQGAVQFMARELMKIHRKGEDKAHSVYHDIESFIWSLCFAVLRWLLNRVKDDANPVKVKAQEYRIKNILTEAFTQQTTQDILRERDALSLVISAFFDSGIIQKTVEALMSPDFIQLFDDLANLLQYSHIRRSPVRLTHESVLEVVNKALSKME